VLYRRAIRRRLEREPNHTRFQQAGDDQLRDGDRVCGAVTQIGLAFEATTVVLTTGTFLSGLIHVGLTSHEAGRAGEPPARRLGARLRELALPAGRLKTGTPPRLDGRTIDFSALERQPGDLPTPVFSFLGDRRMHPEQVACWITHTNAATHDIIRAGLDRSPLFTGVIKGVGPRYCPSIEDKVVRFADRDSHAIYLEPEGLETTEIYPNGISTSLPFDVQLALVRSMKGCEQAHIVRPGYSIEYDYFDPRALRSTLESKAIGGLFFAGQINGTTGYEEAAAQGLLAGINAALHARGKPGWCPRRNEAYLGVLVDDLVTRGVTEPYRMFTSRAEYRLQLREDNADLRLTETGRRLGVVDDRRWEAFCRKRDAIAAELERLKSTRISPAVLDRERATAVLGQTLEREHSLAELLKRPGVTYADVHALAGLHPPSVDEAVAAQVEVGVKYAGYIDRQQAEVERRRTEDELPLPANLDYAAVRGLSIEVRQKLAQHRPESIGQASRISGVTPAAISLLLVHLKRRQAAQAGNDDGRVEAASQPAGRRPREVA
jgi:tRNA uridine 5-carboxymethylaminomethyl modification enzyme